MTEVAPGASAVPWFLEGGGIAGATARTVDWAATPVGPPQGWPATLKTTVATMFRARQPMFLWWGDELIQFYNDAYLPSFGTGKHPLAMGQRGRDCWQEIWSIIGPQIEDVMQRGLGCWNEDALVPIFRNGKIEEVYWSYTYTPVFGDDGRVVGTLVICTETTARVLGARRMGLLGAMVGETSLAGDLDALSRSACEVLAGASADVPLAALFERDLATDRFLAAASVGLAAGDETVIAGLLARGAGDALEGLLAVDGRGLGPGEKIRHLYVASLDTPQSAGAIVFGVSPMLPFDDGYRRFLDQVAGSLRVARRRVEEAAQRVAAHSQLERANQEREDLLRNLQAASRAKDEFLAMLGHELRNPLSPIVTALQLMRQRTGGQPGREQEIIERQVQHLVRLVDDLLDVAKIARGKVELRREVVDLSDVVTKAVEMASDLLEQRQHRLSIDCPKDQFFLSADPIRFSQIIANLLTNAAKYTEPGGHIVVRAARIGGDLELTVADNGMGIAAELLPRIFDLFEQGERSVEQARGGLGIGLALVKNLLALHGGAVSARSDGAGRGSEFTVRVPAAQARVAPAHALETGAAPIRSGHRVLVVDDNVDAAETLKEMMMVAGHDVAMATDPLAALALAPGFGPEVAVLDIGLPVIDGYDLAKRLRALCGPGCRMIALTGYGQAHDRQQSREAGFAEHLVKPIDIDVLLALIDKLMATPAARATTPAPVLPAP